MLGRAKLGQACAQSRLQQVARSRSRVAFPLRQAHGTGSTSIWSDLLAGNSCACYIRTASSRSPHSQLSFLARPGFASAPVAAPLQRGGTQAASPLRCSLTLPYIPASPRPRGGFLLLCVSACGQVLLHRPLSPRDFVGAGARLWLHRCCPGKASDASKLQDLTGRTLRTCQPLAFRGWLRDQLHPYRSHLLHAIPRDWEPALTQHHLRLRLLRPSPCVQVRGPPTLQLRAARR